MSVKKLEYEPRPKPQEGPGPLLTSAAIAMWVVVAFGAVSMLLILAMILWLLMNSY
jgi:hypothetical protein